MSIVEPFVLDTKKLKGPKNRLVLDIMTRFEGAAFLPLSININHDIRLSLAILKDDREKNPLAEDPVELSKVLAQYLRPTVCVLSRWTAITAKRNSELSVITQFCLYSSQQLESILTEMAGASEARPGDPSLQKLYSLADKLRRTGEMPITTVGDDYETSGSDTMEELRRPVSMREIVQLAAEELADQLPENAIDIQGDCTLKVIPDDFYSATSHCLQWFANRPIETSHGKYPLIRIGCDATREGPRVIFEDQSRRLSRRLRQQLFDPFTQAVSPPATSGGLSSPIALYLAKTLVEMRNGGVLEDLSDEIESDVGHRFVMQFPPTETPANLIGT
jgi:hypothetical protein